MNLNKEQIEKVIDWMNTWEQLKNTAIPLRFKEEFTKQLTLTDVVSMCCDETETELKNKIRLADIDYHLRKERS